MSLSTVLLNHSETSRSISNAYSPDSVYSCSDIKVNKWRLHSHYSLILIILRRRGKSQTLSHLFLFNILRRRWKSKTPFLTVLKIQSLTPSEILNVSSHCTFKSFWDVVINLKRLLSRFRFLLLRHQGTYMTSSFSLFFNFNHSKTSR